MLHPVRCAFVFCGKEMRKSAYLQAFGYNVPFLRIHFTLWKKKGAAVPLPLCVYNDGW
jgi:hypothetical protein